MKKEEEKLQPAGSDEDKLQPIASAELSLQFATGSIVVTQDRTYVVFPRIEFDKKDKPPTQNLNTDRSGPPVVRVDVHEIDAKEEQRANHGHSGVERLSLFLSPEPFSQLLTSVRSLRRQPISVKANIDDHGTVFSLVINDEPIVVFLESDVRGTGGGTPAPRTGTNP